MRTTIDESGRVLVPEALLRQIGMSCGELEITVSGFSLVLEPVAIDALVEADRKLLLPDGGPALTTDDIRELRMGDQR